jgi:hypothetical protein
MEKMELVEGDILQLNPEGRYKDSYGGMFVVVTEPEDWGCQGYLLHFCDFPGTRFKGRAFLRPKWEDMEYVGRAIWMYDASKE